MKKNLLFFVIGVLTLLFLLPYLGYSQADGDYRSLKTGGGWASAGTFEVYSAANDYWVPTTIWVASTAYSVGTFRVNGTNLYMVTVAGTSAASGK